ncbi:MAG: hypothetical protein QM754_07035 [Tepidisphaeraceae bacterium]
MELTRNNTAATVLELSDLKDHLSVDGSDSDTVITACQRAAVDMIERETNTQVGPGQYTLVTDFPQSRADIVLPKPPLVSVESVTFTAPDGTSLTLEPDVFRVSTSRPGRLVLRPGRSWPTTAGGGAVTIVYTSGNDLGQVPEALLHCVRLLTGHFFDNREGTSTLTIKEVPLAVASIVNQFRFVEAV